MTDELTICARAIRKCAQEDHDEHVPQDVAIDFARACLTALSENISERMELAGLSNLDRTNPYPGDVAENVFVAMLAAAMGEGE